jgi:ribose-phosphate pyrophosphokinase
MIVLGGSASEQLAERVAKEVGVEPGRREIKKFPDGETYIRIHEEVKGQDVAVIQSLYRNPDPYIFEYLLLVDTLRDLKARSITGITPYLAYGRQDSRFFSGEAVTSLSVARLFEAAGTTSFLAIDCHLHRLGDVSKVFRVPARNLSAMPLLGEYARENLKPRYPVVIAPDEEAEQWAALVAKELNTNHIVFRKTRVRKEGQTSSTVKVDAGSADLKGRDVVFADDVISTGATIAEGAKACKKRGARRVFVLCTHPVLREGALKRMKAAGVLKIIGTDTVPSPVSKVSVAPVIARALKEQS